MHNSILSVRVSFVILVVSVDRLDMALQNRNLIMFELLSSIELDSRLSTAVGVKTLDIRPVINPFYIMP